MCELCDVIAGNGKSVVFDGGEVMTRDGALAYLQDMIADSDAAVGLLTGIISEKAPGDLTARDIVGKVILLSVLCRLLPEEDLIMTSFRLSMILMSMPVADPINVPPEGSSSSIDLLTYNEGLV